jgi:sugar phosphate isomerase/epimerase
MEFGISTQIHRGNQINVDLLESLRTAGYERFELFCNRPHLNFHDRGLMRSIARWFQENGLPAPSLHLPFVENVGRTERMWISVLDRERRHREWAIDEFKRALEITDYANIAYVVMHLGNPKEEFNPVMFEYSFAAISQVRAFAGVEVMIENIPNEISTLERIKEFQNLSQFPDLGICYDAGHAHLQGLDDNLEGIRTTHLHDNKGKNDEHLWPFEGTLNWPALVHKFVMAKYNGPLVFEARGDHPAKGAEIGSRLQDLWAEAEDSIEEYRLKYKIELPPAADL